MLTLTVFHLSLSVDLKWGFIKSDVTHSRNIVWWFITCFGNFRGIQKYMQMLVYWFILVWLLFTSKLLQFTSFFWKIVDFYTKFRRVDFESFWGLPNKINYEVFFLHYDKLGCFWLTLPKKGTVGVFWKQ